MQYKGIPLHDVHVHTLLSLCSDDPSATVEAYLAKAKEMGLELLGISDHMWDVKRVPLENFEFYETMNFERQLARIHDFPETVDGVRLIWGAETEYAPARAPGLLGATAETAAVLDYLLIPHSHLHMKDFVRPADVETPKQLGRYMLKTFSEVADTGLATGIPHPFDPCYMYDRLDEIFGSISDAEFLDCFSAAAKRGISFEINFSTLNCREESMRNDCFFRIFRLAKQAGCKFHFASDAHRVEQLSWTCLENVAWAVDLLGLTQEDISDFVLQYCQ